MLKTNDPLISVVVTTYNRRELLKETIDSILNQTYKNIEVIIIDNFSEDGTREYIEELNDSRITYFRNANNGIIAVNRNFGIQKAKGTFIAFCDDDDIWLPRKLELQLDFIQKNKLGLTFGFAEILGSIDTPSLLYPPKESLAIEDFASLLPGNRITCSTVLVKKECFDQVGCFDENPLFRAIEDFDLWLRISRHYKIKCTPEVVCKYRVHSNNVSGNNAAKEKEKLLQIIEKVEKNKWADEILLRKVKSNVYWGIGNSLLAMKENSYRQWFAKSLKQQLTAKSLLGIVLCLLPIKLASNIILYLTSKKKQYLHRV